MVVHSLISIKGDIAAQPPVQDVEMETFLNVADNEMEGPVLTEARKFD
jgi:hypothetical protein